MRHRVTVDKQRGQHIALLACEIERLADHENLYGAEETELQDNLPRYGGDLAALLVNSATPLSASRLVRHLVSIRYRIEGLVEYDNQHTPT